MSRFAPIQNNQYRFFQDDSHGWLEVPHSEVEASGIEVTPYSYYDSETVMVYLEEDVDMPNFLKASGLASENIKPVDYLVGISGIRTLPPYRSEKTKDEQYQCQSYFDDDNVLRDCTCGKCR